MTGTPIPVEDFDLARQGKGHVYVWGWMTYRDIFFPESPQHLIEFCSELYSVSFSKPDIHDVSNDIGWASGMAANDGCKEHNCEDKDCSDYKAHLQ
jgi:hypothetical protein